MPFSVNEDTVYFILNLTENEHYIVEDMIRDSLQESGYGELVYYRQLKQGHIPMRREVKIKFTNKRVFDMLKDYEKYLEPTNKYEEIQW